MADLFGDFSNDSLTLEYLFGPEGEEPDAAQRERGECEACPTEYGSEDAHSHDASPDRAAGEAFEAPVAAESANETMPEAAEEQGSAGSCLCTTTLGYELFRRCAHTYQAMSHTHPLYMFLKQTSPIHILG